MSRPCVLPSRVLTHGTALALAVVGLAALAALADVPTTVPSPGLRESTPDVIAFTHARLVLGPGRVVPNGTLVLRDGVIVEAGAAARVPSDAVVRDLSGKTIYPGLFDGYTTLGQPKPDAAAAPSGPPAGGRRGAPAPVPDTGVPYWNPQIVPQTHAHLQFHADSSETKALRDQGVAAAVTVPPRGLIKGTSAVVLLGDDIGARLVVKSDVALHVVPTIGQDWTRGYPTSPMGAYTLVRQSFYDADWYARAWAAWQRDRTLPRPETNAALEALQGYAGTLRPVAIECENERGALRADKLAKEFGLHAFLRGSGMEYRRLDAIAALGRPILVPVNFPKAPALDSPDQEMSVELTDLLHWDFAPENPGRLAKAGVTIALTSDGLKDKSQFLKMVRLTVARGLDREKALAALTTTPATLYGVSDRLGTLDAGKIANLVVTDGDLFADKTKVFETWVAGRRYEVTPAPGTDARGTWKLRLAGSGASPTLKLEGEADKLSGSMRDGNEIHLKAASLSGALLTLTVPGDSLGWGAGTVRLSGTVLADEMVGRLERPDGTEQTWSAVRAAPFVAPPDTSKAKPDAMASFPVPVPFSAFGRTRLPERPEWLAVTGATLWTSGPAGRIENGTLLVHQGKIAAVGRNVVVPRGAVVIDAHGEQVSPGIIDCHSHSATDGGINEGGQTVTAEVRIGDFLDDDDVNIYRELAGGTTEAHVLHGSANTIGGQCQLIKLRWGVMPDELKFEGCAPTIKFALGENVKQSNDPLPTVRYPQTRMGVEQLLRDEFQAAKAYKGQWASWNANHRGLPPRRDLELDAMVEVLDGKRLIHCHSYRQDEILALMKVCDEYGAKIAALQHILEGYKLADEIGKRGIGASTFSDWWAYKLEVQDAIPYNTAILANAGVVTSLNSDSNELARRLNSEAGKAVKYGGLSEEDALKLVTWNPARQLRVEGRVGSLEVGKDADFVIWSGSPLLYQSACEQTWIEGRRYFDRSEDQAMRVEQDKMRAALVQKALAESGRDEGKNPFEAKRRPAEDVSCEFGMHEGEGR